MSRQCPVDTSSTFSRLLKEGDDPEALDHLLLGLEVVVPALWRLEVVNTLLRFQRARRHPAVELRAFLADLAAFPIAVLPEPEMRNLGELFDTAKPHPLTSYNAVYLDAAPRHRLPLLTHDRNLRHAAEAEGVELV